MYVLRSTIPAFRAKEIKMSVRDEVTATQPTENDLREALKNGSTVHPVLTRMVAKLNKAMADPEVITSYSRMHHRHNRD